MIYSVVLPCGGKGKRMDLGYNKLFYTLDDQSVIEKTLQVFDQDPNCQQIVIVHAPEEEEQIKTLCTSAKCVFTHGGSERYESVYNGLLLVTETNSSVAKYSSIYKDNKIFVSKYMTYLPTEDELIKVINEEKNIIEEYKLLKNKS